MASILIALRRNVQRRGPHDVPEDDEEAAMAEMMDTNGDGHVGQAEMIKALKTERIGIRPGILVQRLRLEQDLAHMSSKLPLFLLSLILFLAALCELAPPRTNYNIHRHLVSHFGLDSLTSTVRKLEDIYSFIAKFERANEELQATSGDYWCETRYMDFAWDPDTLTPVKTCLSPRKYALGHDHDESHAWKNLPKCLGGGLEDGRSPAPAPEPAPASSGHHRLLADNQDDDPALLEHELAPRRWLHPHHSTTASTSVAATTEQTTVAATTEQTTMAYASTSLITDIANEAFSDNETDETNETYETNGTYGSIFLSNATTSVKKRIFFSLLVANVDFYKLMANIVVLANFVVAVQASVAEEAGDGIEPKHVFLELSAGSVLVKAYITPPEPVALSTVRDRLTASSTLADTIANRVAAVPGIDGVATGAISVTDVSDIKVVVVVEPLITTSSTTRPPGWHEHDFWHAHGHTHAQATEDPTTTAPPSPKSCQPRGISDAHHHHTSSHARATNHVEECMDNDELLQIEEGDPTVTCELAKADVCNHLAGVTMCAKTCGFCGPWTYEHLKNFDKPQVTLLPAVIFQTRFVREECHDFAAAYEDQNWNPVLNILPAMDGERHGRLLSCVNRDEKSVEEYAHHVECPYDAPSIHCSNGVMHTTKRAEFHGETIYPRLMFVPQVDIIAMKNMQWLDMQTDQVTVSTMIYTEGVEVFTSLSVTFTIDQAGNIDADYSMLNYRSLVRGHKAGFIACLILCLLASLVGVCLSAHHLVHAPEDCKWSEELYELLSRFVLFIYPLVLLISWAVQVSLPYEYELLLNVFLGLGSHDQHAQDEMVEQFFEVKTHIYDATNWLERHRVVCYLVLYVQFLQAILYFNAHPKVAVLTATVQKAAGNILHFLLIFGVLFLMMAFMAHWMLGEDVHGFGSYSGAIEAQARMIFGEFIYASGAERLTDTVGFLYWVYAFTFMLIMFFTLLNFFLAIVVDAFTDVKEDNMKLVGVGDFFTDWFVAIYTTLRTRWKRWPSNARLIRFCEDVKERGTPRPTWFQKIPSENGGDSDSDEGGKLSAMTTCIPQEMLDFFSPLMEDHASRPRWKSLVWREPAEEGFTSVEDLAEFLLHYYSYAPKVLCRRKRPKSSAGAAKPPNSAASTATPGDFPQHHFDDLGGRGFGAVAGVGAVGADGGTVGAVGSAASRNLRSSMSGGVEQPPHRLSANQPRAASPAVAEPLVLPAVQQPGVVGEDFSDDESWGEDVEDV